MAIFAGRRSDRVGVARFVRAVRRRFLRGPERPVSSGRVGRESVAFFPLWSPSKAHSSMQEKRPERVAIIGCGAVFHTFYLEAMRRLAASKCCAVVLMVDPNEKQARSFAQYFPGVRIASELSTALGALAVDRAIVLTPPSTHAALLRLLAEAGVHVYCEKPLTVNPAEAEEIAALFRSRRLLCHVGFVRRMFPNFKLLKSVVTKLSDPFHVCVSDGEVFRWPIRTANIFEPAEAGAGVVWDKLSHNLDLVQWLDGIESVDRVTSNCRDGQVPVDVLVAGRTRRGTYEIAVSWTDILPNLVRVRSIDRVVQSKNGLVASLTVSGRPFDSSPVAFDVASYGDAVHASLKAFLAAGPEREPLSLATAEESVPLTKYLTLIDQRARGAV